LRRAEQAGSGLRGGAAGDGYQWWGIGRGEAQPRLEFDSRLRRLARSSAVGHQEEDRRSQRVNTTVLQILESAAGLDERRIWLRRFMTWTPEDVRAADAAAKAQRKVDAKLWR
jgi:hypothetical protein